MADGGVESLSIAGTVVFARKGFGGEGQAATRVEAFLEVLEGMA